MENPAVLFLIIAVTVFATARGLLRWFTTRWRRAVEMAAEPFQLTVVDHMGEPNAAGWVGIIQVRIEVVHQNRGQIATRIAAVPPDLPKNFTLRSGTLRDRLMGEDDLALGDAALDSVAVIQGDEGSLRARLDADTRRKLVAALADGLSIVDGEVQWIHKERLTDGVLLRRCTQEVVALAQALSLPEDERTRLLNIVRTDPEISVRRGALGALIDRSLLTPAQQVELLQALEPADRVLMAPPMGARAWPILEALVVESKHLTSVRRDALVALRGIDLHRAIPVARAAFATSNPGPLTTAALELLADTAQCPPLAELAESIELRLPALRIAVARCLKHSTEPAEPQLLELLEDSDDQVAMAAAESLAVHGTPAAVAPLRARCKSRELRRVADRTIEQIQQGLGRHLKGGLAIATDRAAGSLGLADGDPQ